LLGWSWISTQFLEIEHMQTREAVLREALQLSPSDRAILVDALEESLDRDNFATPEIAAAWSEEIDRRVAAHQSGKSPASSVDEAMDRICKALSSIRSEPRA
jgi:putative addiction module component (TIGR02574 family)